MRYPIKKKTIALQNFKDIYNHIYMNENLKNVQSANEPNVPTNVVMDNDPNIENALIEEVEETLFRNNANTIYNADLVKRNGIK